MTTERKHSARRLLEEAAGGQLTLGALLAAIRLGEDLTLDQFARKLHLSRSHLCDIEKGRKTLSPARAAKFAEILGYSQAQFVRLALQALVKEAGLKLQVRVDAA